MREVARRVHYSPAALYQYFPDKEALIHELCVADFSRLAAAFLELPKDGGPLARLARVGFAYLQFARAYPEHYQFMFMTPTAGSPPESDAEKQDPARNAYILVHALVVEALDAGVLREEFTDSELVAQTIWAAAHGVAALDVCRRSAEDWVDLRPFEERAVAVLRMTTLALARDLDQANEIFSQVVREVRGD